MRAAIITALAALITLPGCITGTQHHSSRASAYKDIMTLSVNNPRASMPAPRDCVVLLHGLTRSPTSMRKLERHLTKEGYIVVNQGYNSREHEIERLAAPAIDEALLQCAPYESKINFVTHSLGGILLRHYLSQRTIDRLGRVVMLGPPNKGSEVSDVLSKLPGFDLLNGPAGAQLGTGESSLPLALGPADFDVGIIAGNRSINLLLSQIIPLEDDGKVAIENTKLEGMNDHITLPVSHPFLMRDKDVLAQISHYLSEGKFSRAAPFPRRDEDPFPRRDEDPLPRRDSGT